MAESTLNPTTAYKLEQIKMMALILGLELGLCFDYEDGSWLISVASPGFYSENPTDCATGAW